MALQAPVKSAQNWSWPEGGKSVSADSSLLCLTGGAGVCRGVAGGGDTAVGRVREGVGEAPISGGGMPVAGTVRLGLCRGVTLVPSTADTDEIADLATVFAGCRFTASLSNGGQTSWSSSGTGTFCNKTKYFCYFSLWLNNCKGTIKLLNCGF